MEDMSAVAASDFDRNYELHLKHLKLKGLQPKTIEAYARAIRRVGDSFDHQIGDLSEADLVDYFTDLRETHSWSSVKLDLYGLKFHYEHVLKKAWVAPGLIKAPRTQRLPDIITFEETERIFLATQVLSCRVFFFTHPAAIAFARTASTTRASNGWSVRCSAWFRPTIFCSPSRCRPSGADSPRRTPTSSSMGSALPIGWQRREGPDHRRSLPLPGHHTRTGYLRLREWPGELPLAQRGNRQVGKAHAQRCRFPLVDSPARAAQGLSPRTQLRLPARQLQAPDRLAAPLAEVRSEPLQASAQGAASDASRVLWRRDGGSDRGFARSNLVRWTTGQETTGHQELCVTTIST